MNRNTKRQRKAPKNYDDLSDFKDLHSGRKCFIVGAGPSLAFLDIQPIHKHVVISVNSSAMLMPWESGDIDSRYWLSNDVLCMKWSYFYSNVLRAKCNKIVRTSWKKKDNEIRGYGFRYFSPRKNDAIIDDSGKFCGTSSIPTAIDFSMYLGCTSIYLIGVDQRMVHSNSHFWQFWNKKKWPSRSDKRPLFRPEQPHQIKVFEKNKLVFQSLQKYAQSKDISIFNCSSRSKVDVFPKISLEEALDE